MANQKISDLTALASADAADVLPIVDTSATETKKISFSALKTSLFPLKAPTGILANPPSYGFTGGDDDTGMYSTGDGNVSIQANGTLKAEFNQNDIKLIAVSGVDVTGDLDVSGNLSAANFPPTGATNTIAYFDGVGDLDDLPDYYINSFGAVGSNLTYQPNGGTGGYNLHETYLDLDPLANTPNESMNMYNLNYNIDPNSSGFDLGTAGAVGKIINLGFNHQGTSDIGQPSYINMNSDIGNGVDAFTMNGFSMITGFLNIDDNVTVTSQLQGYGFQPNMAASSVMNNSIVGFYDSANIQTAVSGYTSIQIGPQVSEIKNNTNYNAININADVDTFTGNAQATLIGVSGNYGTFGTGSFNGILMNPTVTSVVNAYGLWVSMDNVTASGDKKAAYLDGDVEITGSLTFGGALSIGQLAAFYASNPVDGGGNPQNMHGLTTQMTALNGVTTANCDAIGVNTAMLIALEANSISTSGAFGLGFTALALPCVVETHTGATLDFMAASTYAFNLVGTSTGGTIDQATLSRAVVIPNGITTINRLYGFWFHAPFGGVASDEWGVYIEDAANNFMEFGLKLGGAGGDTVNGYMLNVEGDIKFNSGGNDYFEMDATGFAFHGVTPVVQQLSSGPQTAGAVYTATEQTMIQEMYDALRAYGLLS